MMRKERKKQRGERRGQRHGQRHGGEPMNFDNATPRNDQDSPHGGRRSSQRRR